MKSESGNRAYAAARERYGEVGIDTGSALERLASVSISLHCWQGDDVGGFRNGWIGSSAAVWRRPATIPARHGRRMSFAATPTRRCDCIPGKHRFNLHAFYGEFGGKHVDRDEIGPEHFEGWIALGAVSRGRPRFQPDVLLASRARQTTSRCPTGQEDPRVLDRSRIACRRIGAAFGRAQGTPCVTNLWIPDGMKDTPVDRAGPRERLRRVARRHLRGIVRPRRQSGRRRGKAVRHRMRELHRRLARVLFRLRRLAGASC